MLEKMDGFDYRARKSENEDEREFSYVPRTIESVHNTEYGLDNVFDSTIALLSPSMKESDRERLLRNAGREIGHYLKQVSLVPLTSSFDVEGEMYAMAAFQGFLERELMKRGAALEHLFRDPNLLRGINEEAEFIHAEHILDNMRGAHATYEYVKAVEKDPRVIFVGSEVGLDCRHAVDLIIGRGDEGNANIRQIDLVQVKRLTPSREEIGRILNKHKGYAEALLNFESSGYGTNENNKKLEMMSLNSPELFKRKMEEFSAFYNNLNGLNLKLEPTWESLTVAAGDYNLDPILFYIRLKSINDVRLSVVPKQFVRNMLKMVKEKVDQIELPQAIMAERNRLTRGPHHITSAEEVYSTIVANGAVISRVKLTK